MISDGSEFGQWNGSAHPCYDDFGLGTCDAPYEPDWSQFIFTAPDGTQYRFDSAGKLYQRIDRNNNSLTFDYSGITHSSGKQVTFTRDGFGRITEIYDPIAIASSGVPAIKYGYDANGNVTNVARLVNRASGGTYENTSYRYDDGSLPHPARASLTARHHRSQQRVDGSAAEPRYDTGHPKSITYEQNAASSSPIKPTTARLHGGAVASSDAARRRAMLTMPTGVRSLKSTCQRRSFPLDERDKS